MLNKDQEALKLASAHYDIEPGMVQIYRIDGESAVELQPDEPIKLLEVNQDTIAVGVLPIGFGPAPERGFHFSSVIVEVTPGEFAEIQAQKLVLPSGWTIGKLLPRSGTTASAVA